MRFLITNNGLTHMEHLFICEISPSVPKTKAFCLFLSTVTKYVPYSRGVTESKVLSDVQREIYSLGLRESQLNKDGWSNVGIDCSQITCEMNRGWWKEGVSFMGNSWGRYPIGKYVVFCYSHVVVVFICLHSDSCMSKLLSSEG
jgi:hypothetical protein